MNNSNKIRKKDEIRERRTKILKLLIERPYTVNELMTIFDVSKKSIQDDIADLKLSYDIGKHKKNVGYIIPDDKREEYRKNIDSSGVYQHSIEDDITKTIIILVIQREGGYVTEKQLKDGYELFFDPYKENTSKKEDIGIIEYLRSKCRDLVKEGIIEKRIVEKYN